MSNITFTPDFGKSQTHAKKKKIIPTFWRHSRERRSPSTSPPGVLEADTDQSFGQFYCHEDGNPPRAPNVERCDDEYVMKSATVGMLEF